jgi:hypothetical protein
MYNTTAWRIVKIKLYYTLVLMRHTHKILEGVSTIADPQFVGADIAPLGFHNLKPYIVGVRIIVIIMINCVLPV